MIIKDNLSKQDWETAVSQFAEANFLQSWNWGAFQESLGKKVIRLAWFDESNSIILALAQGVVEKAKRGNYLAMAGGPLLNWGNVGLMEQVFATLRTVAKNHGCWFIRFRPQALNGTAATFSPVDILPASMVDNKNLRLIGSRQAPMHLTADLTIQLDLTLSETELLAQMRKNHRQSIKKANNLGITTRISTDEKELSEFYTEQLSLARHHGFVPFPKSFLVKQFQAFAKDGQVALIHSELQGELLASAYIIFYNGEAVYHYGVSTQLNQQYPGSYACQWRAIIEARVRGCRRYNLWGVSPKDQPHHRFAGVGLFKRGFGGQEINFLSAQDIVLDKRYYLTWLFENLRRRLRNL